MARDADLLVHGAAELLLCTAPADGARGDRLGRVERLGDGAVAIRDGRIVDVGGSRELRRRWRAGRTLDARGRLVTPGLIDPHTHLVHAGSRHEEWERRVRGQPRGIDDGIRATVRQTRAATTAELTAQAHARLDVALAHGTTTLEAKSGYGLDPDSELRLLGVLGALRHPIDVVPTYLGAHVLPSDPQISRAAYVQQVIDTLPRTRGLAECCDATCDPIAFTADECERIAAAARACGLRLRLHADQTGHAGGTALAARLGADSADHLEHVRDDDLVALAASDTVGVLLPGVTYHLMEMVQAPYDAAWLPPRHADMPQRVRGMVASGACLALATDYNPGTCPTLSLQAIMQLAARLLRLTYAEIWHMCTINAAHALHRQHDRGSIEVGKLADLVVWDVAEHGMVINRFGANHAHAVIKRGAVVSRPGAGAPTPPG